jgi:hypothetical protein
LIHYGAASGARNSLDSFYALEDIPRSQQAEQGTQIAVGAARLK